MSSLDRFEAEVVGRFFYLRPWTAIVSQGEYRTELAQYKAALDRLSLDSLCLMPFNAKHFPMSAQG